MVDLNGDQVVTTTCVFFTNTGIRQQDGSRSGGAIWTKPNVIITHHYNNIYTMSDNQEREEVHTGYISDDSIATGQERRTRLYNKGISLEENYREEAVAEIANRTPISHLERYV